MNAPLLEITGLRKCFGKHVAVDDATLSVHPGQVVGLLGPNGAGKTTLIKTALGLLRADAGQVTICGYDLRKQMPKAMAQVGAIIENPDLYGHLSGERILRQWCRARKLPFDRIEPALAQVGMSSRGRDKLKKYSLGMKQRLGLALVLVHEPKLLILDEPTNGLDPAGIKELRELLRGLAHERGMGILVSSHLLSEMEMMCDRALIMNRGHILNDVDVHGLSALINEAPKTQFTFADPTRAAELLEELYPDVEFTLQDGILTVHTETEDLPALIRSWIDADLFFASMKTLSPTLEDAFLSMTMPGGASV